MSRLAFPFSFAFGLLLLSSFSCAAQSAEIPVAAMGQPLASSRSTLFQTDFETASWPNLAATAVGTIDVAGSTQPSRGLAAASLIASGPLPVRSAETNLGKLTLAFSLSASAARPVVVRVESFDRNKKRSGGLETRIYPAAPDFYQRYALDLNTFTRFGSGKFAPTAPFLGFSVAIDRAGWNGIAKSQIRLDNLQFAQPAFYVSALGSDQNDGQTAATAFATPQKALDMAGPGDIIVVMDGSYRPSSEQSGIAGFRRAGSPAKWISLKNYPGQHPLFALSNAWAAVRIGRAAQDVPAGDTSPSLAYLEVRGLHIRGEGDVAKAKYPDAIGKPDPRTNGNGLMADARAELNPIHHLRFADNLVEFCPGAGIGPGGCDWVTIENNVVRNNSWTTMYGTSGISINGGTNFDGTSGGTRDLIRNNIVSGNRTFEPWAAVKKISDGNGIIIDVNQDENLAPQQRFSGRTLIQNNLTFGNGGSGIHAFKSRRVDIINNTAYFNGAAPELRWGQIFLQRTDDANIINNILVSRDGQPINTVSLDSNDRENTHVLRAGNLLFGGAAPILGETDLIRDPRFVRPSEDAKVADFHLQAGSAARGTGKIMPFSPFLDLDGKPRGARPSAGAFQP